MKNWIKRLWRKLFAKNLYYNNCTIKTYSEGGQSVGLSIDNANRVFIKNCSFQQYSLWDDYDPEDYETYRENIHLDDILGDSL